MIKMQAIVRNKSPNVVRNRIYNFQNLMNIILFVTGAVPIVRPTGIMKCES